MIIFYSLLITILISLTLNFFFKKKNFLLNSTGDLHQKFLSSLDIPLTGGLILLILLLIFSSENYINNIFYLLIFMIGIFSDLKKLRSPPLRLVLQIITVILAIFFLNIFVETTRVVFIDGLLSNFSFKFFFTVFCILIIINGCNFIDGVNTLLLGYILIILSILKYLSLGTIELSELFNIDILISVIFVIFLLNFFNKLYLGDGGSYLIGMIISLFLIDTYNANGDFSPFYIVNLLWYPAFENLFSFLRKIKFERSPILPDTNHLHQLVYLYLKRKIKINQTYLNTATGLVINLYNLFIILYASKYIFNTQAQILFLSVSAVIYIFIYSRLFSLKIKKISD